MRFSDFRSCGECQLLKKNSVCMSFLLIFSPANIFVMTLIKPVNKTVISVRCQLFAAHCLVKTILLSFVVAAKMSGFLLCAYFGLPGGIVLVTRWD